MELNKYVSLYRNDFDKRFLFTLNRTEDMCL